MKSVIQKLTTRQVFLKPLLFKTTMMKFGGAHSTFKLRKFSTNSSASTPDPSHPSILFYENEFMLMTRIFDPTLLNATETYVLTELDASLKLLSS